MSDIIKRLKELDRQATHWHLSCAPDCTELIRALPALIELLEEVKNAHAGRESAQFRGICRALAKLEEVGG